MIISDLADGILRSAQGMGDAVLAPFSDPVIRLGVTGLSRAGKTVFITSLVANLLDRGRMPALSNAPQIEAAFLQPQPDDTIARFAYEDHIARLTAPEPAWPQGTRRVSELRLSLRLRPAGMFGGIQGARMLHLDIIDYPGEWLLDLGLMDKTYAQWSAQVLQRVAIRPEAAAYRAAVEAIDPAAKLDEMALRDLSQVFTAYLHEARANGWSDCSPGRFLLPGDMEGSPVLTFAPLPGADGPRGSLWREAERRFDAYKRQVVTPFFRDHFTRIDRQVVLVDLLSAIHAGPAKVEDLRQTMAEILRAFRPGPNAWLTRLMGGHQIERILFAATKADHLHHSQHDRLSALAQAMLREARDRADFAGAKTAAMAIAALRTTTEDQMDHKGTRLDVVRGVLENGKQAAFHPAPLPEDPSHLLAPARDGATGWADEYQFMNFAPARLSLRPGDGPPHIRLDRAAEFLFGDRL